MALFALSDLHLPLGNFKPMDVFGNNWNNYVERIEEEWKKTVTENDVVIINGDFSWATYVTDALPDFKFINNLPGVKLISKGNHDYWWETKTKLNAFLERNNLTNIHFIHNSTYLYKDYAICASRGWITPSDKDFKTSDEKMYNRELGRLRLSLTKGMAQNPKGLIAALHYPPQDGFLDVLEEFDVKYCIYGHLHGKSALNHIPKKDNHILVSADFLKFKPVEIVL
ncbi:MAG: metallophosphoesterase [Clostridia bacterium]